MAECDSGGSFTCDLVCHGGFVSGGIKQHKGEGFLEGLHPLLRTCFSVEVVRCL